MTPPPDTQPSDPSRRDFLRAGALAGAGLTLGAHALDASFTGPHPADGLFAPSPPKASIRIGFVGVGGQGTSHVENLVRIEGAEVVAVCDLREERVANAQDIVEKSGRARPKGYARGPRDFERMCDELELDLVYTATPWEWHTPIALYAMKTGKHAATEVPMTVTLDESWQLVEASEKAKKHCVMMENCVYSQRALLWLTLVRKGLIGEVLHGEGGYLHDLRGVKFDEEGEGWWRRPHSMRRNGNLYPTHGLGPVATCMDINRGDRFASIVSMSGPSRGLQLWQEEHLAKDDPRRKETFKLGDVNVSLIRTAKGKTIYLGHNTNSPRPYSRLETVQGTRGILSGYPDRIYIEGRSPEDQWEPMQKYLDEFNHPLWAAQGAAAAGRGHGGMDYLEDYRLIKALKDGVAPDLDVYDGAAWSVLSELSERSVAKGSAPMEVPDFTRGRWASRPPLIIGD